MKSFCLKVLFSIIVIFSLFSCEIGLGPAVDTEAPVITITTPEPDKIIRDAFRMNGTWSDDGTIKSLTITLDRTDSIKQSYGPFEGTVIISEQEGGINTWNCLINPESDNMKILDGSYVATVTITDEGEHTTIQTRSFVIDNTPPVVVLQRPFSKIQENTPDAYGQTFTLEGQAADDNNVSLIEVNIYSDAECSNLVHTVQLNNVPNSINIDVAKFVENDLSTDYSKIYGSASKDGTKRFYCKLLAYDGAQSFPATGESQSPADLKGNKTETYYIYEDISASILSSHKITDVYHMQNGTYLLSGGNRAATEVNDVKVQLSKNEVTAGSFTLNPANNPKFTIAGRDALVLDGKDFDKADNNVSNGSSIVVEVATGLDSIPLIGESLKVYLLPCNSKGEPATDVKIYPDTTVTKSGTSYKFVTSITTDKGLVIGKNYIIGIDGTDQSKNGVLPNGNAFGFHLAASGAAPILTITEPAAGILYKKKNDVITIKGTTVVEEGFPTVTARYGDTPISMTCIDSGDGKTYNLSGSITLTGDSFAQKDLMVTSSNSGQETSKNWTVIYDVNPPEIGEPTITPIAYKYNTDESGDTDGYKYLNGKIKVRVSISDNDDSVYVGEDKQDIHPPKIEFKQGANNLLTERITTPVNQTFEIDTTNFTTGSLDIVITAYDRAGNEKKETLTYLVDQETDKPTVLPYSNSQLTFVGVDTLSNYNDKTGENASAYNKNKYVANSQMMLRLIDDDGIQSVKIYRLFIKDDTTVITKPGNTVVNKDDIGGSTDFSLTCQLPEKAGLYAFWIEVTDINGIKNENIDTPFIVKVTTAAPIISIEKSSEYKPVAGSMKYTISIESTEEPFTLFRKTSADSDFSEITTGITYNNKQFIDTVNPSTTTEYTYKVKDKNGNFSNEKSMVCKVDLIKPTVIIKTPLEDTTFTGINSINTTQRFDGTCEDTDSKVKTIWYKVTSDSSTVSVPEGDALLDTIWKNAGWYSVTSVSTTDWNFYQAVQSGTSDSVDNGTLKLGEGSRTLYVCAVDNAGNTSEVKSKKFYVDLSAPNFDKFTVTEGSDCIKSGEKYYIKSPVKGTLKVTDTNGISTIQYKVGSGSIKDLPLTGSESTKNWEISIDDSDKDKDVLITIIVTDKANRKTEKSITVYRDTVAPIPEVTSLGNDEVISSRSKDISGSITESGCGTEKIYYKVTSDEITQKPNNFTGWKEAAVTGSSWSGSITNDAEGKKYLHYIAEDKLGNIADTLSCVTFIYDTNKPQLIAEVSATQTKGAFTLKGKAWDSNKVNNVIIKEGAREIVKIETGLDAKEEPATYNWSKELTPGNTSDTVSDGLHTYTITVTDAAGKETEKELEVLVDTKAPEVVISSVPNIEQTEKQSFEFSGTSSDANGNLSVSNVNTVEVVFIDKPATVTPDAIKNAANARVAANKLYSAIYAGGNWSYTALFAELSTEFASEGDKYICARATDKVGNTSEWVSKPFVYDKAKPTVTIDKYNSLNSISNGSFETSSAFSLSGSISDSYKLAASGNEIIITQTKGSEEITLIGNITVSNGTWTLTDLPRKNANSVYSNTDSDNDWTGKYTYKVTAKDATGKQSEPVTVDVIIDKVAPVINKITSPSTDVEGDNSLYGTSFIFKGIATDNENGTGVAKIYYAMTSTSEPTNETTWTPIPTGDSETWSVTKTLGTGISGNSEDLYEGVHYLHVKAEDKAGNVSSVVTRKFSVDQSKPVITETCVGTEEKKYKAGNNIILEGTASDTNGVSSIVIWEGETQLKEISSGFESWTSDITSDLPDGKHTLTVVVTDKAGKKETITRKVWKDTKAPTGTLSVTTTAKYEKKNAQNEVEQYWYNTPSIGIKLAGVKDILENGNASGISTVEYTTDDAVAINNDSALWTSLIKGSANAAGGFDYTANVYCSKQGINTITTRIKDSVGNAATNFQIVYIDTNAPDTPTAWKVNGTDSYTGTILSNKSSNVIVELTVSDGENGSGIKEIFYGTSTVSTPTNGKYTLTIDKSQITSGSVNIKIKDYTDNETTFSKFSFDVDTDKPVSSIISPSNKDSLYGTSLTVSGTVKETHPKSIALYCREDTPTGASSTSIAGWTLIKKYTKESAPAVPVENTEYGKSEAEITDWSISGVDFNERSTASTGTNSDGYKHDIYLMAVSEDTHGNISEVNSSNWKKYTVDMDKDRPVIRFSTLDFSTSPIWLKNQTKLIGTITDSDGIKDNKFQISVDNSTWKDISVVNGAWSYDLVDLFDGTTAGEKEDAANGEKTLYFKVTDGNNKTFNSCISNSDSQSSVYLEDSNGTKVGNLADNNKTKTKESTILNLTVDTLPPTVEIKEAKISGGEFTTSVSTLKLGGNNKSFVMNVKAKDGVSIKKVSGTANFKKDSSTIVELTGTVTGPDNYVYEIDFELTDENITTLRTNSFDGTVDIRVVAEDTAGNKTTMNPSISADFKNPVLLISAPDGTQYSSGNVTAYGTIDSTTKMYYALSLDDTTTPGADELNKGSVITSWKKEDGTNGENAVSYQPYYKEIYGNALQWFIYFDGGRTTDVATHDVPFNTYLVDFGITTNEAIKTTAEDEKFKTIVKVWLWVKAVDEAGNETVEKYPILIDPQGDAPKVTIDYPEENGTTLGGIVTLRGTATDTIGTNVGVDSVWLQIISAKENGYDSSTVTTTQQTVTAGGLKFKDEVTPHTVGTNTTYTHEYTINEFKPTLKDVKQWIEKGYNVYTNITDTNPLKITTTPAGADTADGSAYYIKASFSGSAWNIKINTKSEFNPDSEKLNPVAYRVYAKDKDNILSKVQEQFGIFDSDNPVISEVYLRQYSNNDTGAGSVTASRSYEDDMWIQGVWWLEGKVQDTQGLSSLTVDGENQEPSDVANIPQTFKYKLATGTSGSAGHVSVEVEAQDKVDPGATPHITKRTYSINYDNKNPEIITTGTDFKINSKIQNSNGFYSFGSQVKEDVVGNAAQSGFDYLAFWIERDITSKHVVYDVMRSKDNSEVEYSGLTPDSGLMWKTKTVTRDANALGTFTLEAEDTNIHVGGLCKIGGSIYKVTSVSKTTVNINGQPESSYTEALFAIANVVDNTIESGSGIKSTEDGKYGYFSSISNDDGDNMVESVQKSGTTWTWEANINSQNIPDGSVKLHYVAFDKAGNYTTGEVTDAQVANNAPRLAGLTVWSDFNGNGTREEGEYETKYYGRKSRVINGHSVYKATDTTSKLVVSGNNNDYDSATPGTKFMTVKAVTTFIPEIIGGNGDLYYSRKIGPSSSLGAESYGSSLFGKGHYDGIDDVADEKGYNVTDDEGTAYIKGHTGYGTNDENEYKLVVSNDDLNNLTNGSGNAGNGLKWFNYTIYDSTDGCNTWTSTSEGTQGRLKAEFHVCLDVQYQDSTPPLTYIDDLYWNSTTDNSVYQDANNKLFGHVELKQDLTYKDASDQTVTTVLGTTYGTDDDKVSGKIVFRGTAYDNKQLKSLTWGIDNSSDSSIWTSAGTVNFASNIWSEAGEMNTDHYEFRVYTDAEHGAYNNQNGHKVAWELAVDTSYITGVVASNAKIYVTATDTTTGSTKSNSKSDTPNTTSTDDAVRTRPRMQIDILPYITDISSRLAKMNTPDPTAYSRTARGHYPIASDEGNITLKGYNLAAGNADVTVNSVGTMTTGAYSYTVSGTISTINNMNNNNAHGTYNIDKEGLEEKTKVTNMYNRTPNTNTNLKLTDDVYFDVWEMNSNSATSGSALKYPVMHINPTNNQIGFGFVKGSDSISFPGDGYSYLHFQRNRKDYTGTNFVYDSNGVAHNISIGLDAQWDTGIAGRMNYSNSNWWAGNDGSQYTRQWDKRYAIALESIGIPNNIYLKGTRVDKSGENNGKGIIDTERFSTPSIAASSHNTGTAVYIMYYDTDHDQIRFRYGEIPNTGTSRATGNTYTGYGLINDNKCENYNGNTGTTTIPSDQTNVADTWGDHDMFEASKDYYALITGDYYKQNNDGLAGTPGSKIQSTGNKGSIYNALDVVPGNTMNDDIVVIVWYDDSAKNLKYIYRYNLGTNTNASNENASSDGVTGKWSKPKIILDKAVEDCTIKVDANKGIHIAAYDSTNADLYYVYMSGYDSDTTYSCVVDSYSQIGNKVSLDTAIVGGKVVPYISYFAAGFGKMPKLAYLPNGIDSTNVAGSIKPGAETSTALYTGDWECTLIPTTSALQEYNVSIGVFKNTTDKKTKIIPNNVNDVIESADRRKRYANGTSDLVLGYAIKSVGVGYIETAMRKGVPTYE